MKKLRTALLAIAAASVLAACANGVIVSQTGVSHTYSPAELAVAGSGGNQLRVTVAGNPFDIPQDEFSQAVVDSMQGKALGAPVTFALDPEQEDTARHHRVVVAFNPVNIRHPSQLCEAPFPPETTADAAELTVMGAYCQNGWDLSYAAARAAPPAGPDTERFRYIVSQLTMSLFPWENPHLRPAEDAVFLQP